MSDALSRRRFLALTGAGAAGLALVACGGSGGPIRITSADPSVAAAEAQRRRPGAAVRDVAVTAGAGAISLAQRMDTTWDYNQTVPGPEIRLTAGEVLRAKITNNLPEATTIHWHGLALRNDMDGVPGVTQKPIPPGGSFVYEFATAAPGTYWFHPHFGTQVDRGLYAPLIIDDPHEPGGYDRELTVVLDDWLPATGPSPGGTLKALKAGGMGSMQMARSPLLGGDAGDVTYPFFLANGRTATDPQVVDVTAGERIRLRLINVGSDTAFRVAVGGHRVTVTHTDGFAVVPTTTDAVLIGMAERYDAIVTIAESGAFPLVALAEGKGNQALVVLRSSPGAANPPADVHPAELDGQVIQAPDLRAAPAVTLASRKPDRTFPVVLQLAPQGYRWSINGRSVDDAADVLTLAEPLDIRRGERIRLVFDNRTTMFHPMHIHGHTFQIVGPGGSAGPRKDTTIVKPQQQVTVDFDADNPGQWLMHCHNLYHMEAGMHGVISYVR